MKVLITGGAGDIGHVTARWLVDRGWTVRVLDRADSLDIPGIEYRSGDVTDYDTVHEAVRGCEGIIHLAALRNPWMGSNQDVYRVNTVGTFNVFEAAAAEGIRRVAQASSINALGCIWNIEDMHLNYLPVDEDHPLYTMDPYSFSKEAVEDIAAYYWRRERISSTSLRFPGVRPVDSIQSEDYRAMQQKRRKVIDDLLALPEAEQTSRLAGAREFALEYHARRLMEVPPSPERESHNPQDPLWSVYAFDRFNLWTVVDVRDAAQSLEKSLTADFEGPHPLFINDPDNTIQYDSRTLARLFLPDVPVRDALTGTAALVSIEKARKLLGYEPAYTLGKANPSGAGA